MPPEPVLERQSVSCGRNGSAGTESCFLVSWKGFRSTRTRFANVESSQEPTDRTQHAASRETAIRRPCLDLFASRVMSGSGALR